MARNPVKIIIPKDPVQIGKTPQGAPIWCDPKDLVPNEDEKLQIKENLLNSHERNAINKLVQAVLTNAGRFIQDTFYHIAPKEVIEAHEDEKIGIVADWAAENRYEVIQDGLVTVIKFKGKELRRMKADVNPVCRDLVEHKVRQAINVSN